MKNKKIIVLFVLLAGITMRAQISNTGTMNISPNTVVGMVSDFDNKESGTLLNDGELHLHSHFKNNGLVTFSSDEKGITQFKGNLVQKIEGTGTSEFQNLQINNTGAEAIIELHSQISIAKQADFTQGILNNETFGGLVVFEQGATHVNTSDESYIDGKIKKNGDEAFTFPVGHDGNFRHSVIAATKEALSSFEGNYFFKNSDLLFPHSSKVGAIDIINNQEYWTLEKHGGTANAMLTLSWDETTTTPYNVIDSPEDIHIVRWDETRNLWVDEGGVADVANRTVTTPVSVSGYGVFTLAKAAASGYGPCRKLVVYNAISANGDGVNDYLRIDGLKDCSNGSNIVQIYNRWGIKVFEARDYGENGNVFEGYANVNSGFSPNKLLPPGTYFYIIEGNGANAQMIKKSGYLFLN